MRCTTYDAHSENESRLIGHELGGSQVRVSKKCKYLSGVTENTKAIFTSTRKGSKRSIMMNRSLVVSLLVALLALQSHAFVVKTPVRTSTALEALASKEMIKTAFTTAAVTIATNPLVAIAVADDDYEYGAVNAPIGLAWGVGVLAILTALLPIALRGGEEAFEEMKEPDKGTWGTGNSKRLNSRK